MLLDSALQLAGRGWPIFRLSGKIPLKGSHGHLDATTDIATITRWFTEKPNSNIGLATGRIVVIDPDGPSAVARLAEIGKPHGGWPKTLTAKTPRSLHLYYWAPPGVEIRSYNEPRAKKGDEGIDIKGSGGYCVLPPSRIKKDGQWLEYKWLLEVPIVELPAWGVEWINSLKGVKNQQSNILFSSTTLPDYIQSSNAKNDAAKGLITKRASAALGEPWSEALEARIWSALEAIPATGYDRWITVGMALKSLEWERPDGTDIGFELFDDWSATQPDLYSLDATEKKWQSFRRSGIGLGSLFHLAEQHDWQGLIPQIVKEVIEPPTPHPFFSVPTAGGVNGHAVADDLLPPASEESLIALNAKYATIGDLGGKCMVLGWIPSKVDETVKVPSFQTFRSFTERFSHKYVTTEVKDGETKRQPMGAYWLKWGRRKSFEGIDLVPNAPAVLDNQVLNLWQGFAVAPRQGRWDRMKEHIAEVLAEGSADQLGYIMRWSAWAVQHPGDRAEVSLVFRGDKGSGKGTFAHALRRLFGQHGLHISNSKHLVGAFNAHLRNCLFLFADEAFWAGDKQGESVLKALITEPVLMIEQKGVDATQWRNRVHMIMAANAEWVVPASHDERRYAMFNVSNKKLRNETYFNALHDEINNGGLEAMLFDLLHVKLGDWHPRKVPNTEALRQQKIRSMTNLQEWWEQLLQEATIPAAGKEPDIAMTQYLINHAREFAPRLRELTPAALGRFLADHGCIKLHRANGNAWRFPEINAARQEWERRYQGWQWHEKSEKWASKS